MVRARKYLSLRLFVISIISVYVLWISHQYYQYESAELLDFYKHLAFEYISLTREYAVTTECPAIAWSTPDLQAPSLEIKQAELVHRLVEEYITKHFGSEKKQSRTYHNHNSSDVAWGYIVLSLQLITIATICVTSGNLRSAPNWDQLLEDCFPIWSSLPVLCYLWKRWFRWQQNWTFNNRPWRFSQPKIVWFFGLSAVAVLLQQGLVKGLLAIFQALLCYEAPSLIFSSVFDGSLSLLGGGTPRKLAQLRHKPRLAALMVSQIPIWFLCADILPVTVTATICLLLRSGDEPEYLAHDSLESIRTRQFSFCEVCNSVVLPVLRKNRTANSTPHHWTSKALFEAMEGGCRICTAVWQLRTQTPKDVWSILLFWRPVTTFTTHGKFMWICQEENQRYQCRFDLLETDCKSSIAGGFSSLRSVQFLYSTTLKIQNFLSTQDLSKAYNWPLNG
jgi:hypothetical protein